MDYRELGRTGLRVSLLGFGAAPLGSEYGQIDVPEATRTVHQAVDSGINFFDTAPYYGRGVSETRLGEMLEGRRSKIVLATKCARYDIADFDFSAERIARSIEESLTRLRTDYIDLFQVHDVEFGSHRQIVEETLPAMRKLQQTGKARFIGITGLSITMLRQLASEFPVDTILSYCRYNLLNTDLRNVLADFASVNGVGLINASPLHMRLLSPAGATPWHPAPQAVREAAQKIVELCAAHGVPAPQLALQFSTRAPFLASTFVGLSSTLELQENLLALAQPLDLDLLRQAEELAMPVRGQIWPSGRSENYDAFTARA